MTDTTRCGTVVLAGRPNAGKSSLLNRLVGEPIAIVSPKPQTTRLPVIGLLSDVDVQIAFVDPPGLLDPAYLLQHAMLEEAHTALRRADAILYLHPITDGVAPPLSALLCDDATIRKPCLTVRTKSDLPAAHHAQIMPGERAVSATNGEGVDEVLAWCRRQMPPGPFRFDPADISTQPTRFFVAEFVREAAFDALADEVPYALATDVDEFREGSDPLYIRVVLYVERESQKGIVVGERGRTIKRIGSRARATIERFLDTRVYLDLWVKTMPKWRSDAGALRRLGFSINPTRRR